MSIEGAVSAETLDALAQWAIAKLADAPQA
jgi:hypothetical protein